MSGSPTRCSLCFADDSEAAPNCTRPADRTHYLCTECRIEAEYAANNAGASVKCPVCTPPQGVVFLPTTELLSAMKDSDFSYAKRLKPPQSAKPPPGNATVFRSTFRGREVQVVTFKDRAVFRQVLGVYLRLAHNPHENIEKLVAFSDDATGALLILPVYLPIQRVVEQLHTEEQQFQVSRIISALRLALNHLHITLSPQVLHMAVNSENIGVAPVSLAPGDAPAGYKGYRVVLCNFLWAKQLSNPLEESSSFKVTEHDDFSLPWYKHSGELSANIDLYSLGLVKKLFEDNVSQPSQLSPIAAANIGSIQHQHEVIDALDDLYCCDETPYVICREPVFPQQQSQPVISEDVKLCHICWRLVKMSISEADDEGAMKLACGLHTAHRKCVENSELEKPKTCMPCKTRVTKFNATDLKNISKMSFFDLIEEGSFPGEIWFAGELRVAYTRDDDDDTMRKVIIRQIATHIPAVGTPQQTELLTFDALGGEHPNIVSLLALCLDAKLPALVIPRYTPLASELNQLSPSQLLSVCRDVATAVQFIHERRIAHLTIHLDKIFIEWPSTTTTQTEGEAELAPVAKIGGFQHRLEVGPSAGLFTPIPDHIDIPYIPGVSDLHMHQTQQYGLPHDVFALAVTLLCILFQKPNMTMEDLVSSVPKTELDFLLIEALHSSPTDRTTAKKINAAIQKEIRTPTTLSTIAAPIDEFDRLAYAVAQDFEDSEDSDEEVLLNRTEPAAPVPQQSTNHRVLETGETIPLIRKEVEPSVVDFRTPANVWQKIQEGEITSTPTEGELPCHWEALGNKPQHIACWPYDKFPKMLANNGFVLDDQGKEFTISRLNADGTRDYLLESSPELPPPGVDTERVKLFIGQLPFISKKDEEEERQQAVDDARRAAAAAAAAEEGAPVPPPPAATSTKPLLAPAGIDAPDGVTILGEGTPVEYHPPAPTSKKKQSHMHTVYAIACLCMVVGHQAILRNVRFDRNGVTAWILVRKELGDLFLSWSQQSVQCDVNCLFVARTAEGIRIINTNRLEKPPGVMGNFPSVSRAPLVIMPEIKRKEKVKDPNKVARRKERMNRATFEMQQYMNMQQNYSVTIGGVPAGVMPHSAMYDPSAQMMNPYMQQQQAYNPMMHQQPYAW